MKVTMAAVLLAVLALGCTTTAQRCDKYDLDKDKRIGIKDWGLIKQNQPSEREIEEFIQSFGTECR
jgi:hypothetical protein